MPTSRRLLAADLMISEPVPGSPVNKMASTSGCSDRKDPVESRPKPFSNAKAPSGISEAAITSARIEVELGVSSDGFAITALPITKAGATFNTIINKGTFQGAIQAITPLGRRCDIHNPSNPAGPTKFLDRFSRPNARSQ